MKCKWKLYQLKTLQNMRETIRSILFIFIILLQDEVRLFTALIFSSKIEINYLPQYPKSPKKNFLDNLRSEFVIKFFKTFF